MLIGNALSVARWLEANSLAKQRLSYGGVVGIVLVLIGIAIAFKPIVG
jgi:hypothetical protein